ncbi:ASCH domain-containing protein [Schlesneria paludicola]|uniref:hypothetical protein n=1 Tax=Schlesneria paludicola TaxID=360056 RepID=UPI00029A0C67|nr:hypothetical protein [Schlesneria paludicola]
MRNISFALTTPQFRAREKSVTRRLGWASLAVGQLLCGVVKGMGMKPGEKVERLGVIRVISVRREALSDITHEDVELEGFPTMSRDEFITMFCNSHTRCTPETVVTRIEYEYVD